MDIYTFKSKNYYASTFNTNEINIGIKLYSNLIKKISYDFNIKPTSIKLKLHPATDINLKESLKINFIRLYS